MPIQKTNNHNQITLSKIFSEKYNIRPGDYIEIVDAGDHIEIYPVEITRKATQEVQNGKK